MTSNAGMPGRPRRWATHGAVAGQGWSGVFEARTSASTLPAPAEAMARAPASAAMSPVAVRGPAMRRSAMPMRSRIHASEVSMRVQSSLLRTRRGGSQAPSPVRTAAPRPRSVSPAVSITHAPLLVHGAPVRRQLPRHRADRTRRSIHGSAPRGGPAATPQGSQGPRKGEPAASGATAHRPGRHTRRRRPGPAAAARSGGRRRAEAGPTRRVPAPPTVARAAPLGGGRGQGPRRGWLVRPFRARGRRSGGPPRRHLRPAAAEGRGRAAKPGAPVRRPLWKRGIKPLITRRGVVHGSGPGKVRWVVQRVFAWLHRFKRLRIRHERRADLHQGLLQLACSLISLR